MTFPGLIKPDTALFLDFDGTLAPLQDDPDTVFLPDGGGALLSGLSERLGGAMALVSGRDVRDLAKRVPKDLWRAGNHGDLVMRPGTHEADRVEGPPGDLLTAIEALLTRMPEVRLEEKARVLALHTRQHPDMQDAVAQAVAAVLAERSDYRMQRGKDIVELKPAGVHKGEAIRSLLKEKPFCGRAPVFLGDDVTDEDGFEACLALNGSAIKIGEGATIAPHRLSGPDAVWAFLEEAYRDLT